MKKTVPFILNYLFISIGAMALIAATGLAILPDKAPAPTPSVPPSLTPTINSTQIMPSIQDRLAPPPTVYPPTQVDDGAQVYYQVCMACHGDRGQGLTDEWRQAWDPPDRDCWQSGCHNPHHPPDGFVFPKVVPAVVGAGVLEQFQTAANLHAFIKTKMPFQAPGSLKEDEYWQLTAYLLRLNGYSLPFAPLDEQTAQRISLTAQPAPPAPTPVYMLLAIAILTIVVLVLIIILFSRLRMRSRQGN